MNAPVTLKLNRQQIECLRVHFFPYMLLLCKTRVNDTAHDLQLNLNEIIVETLLQDFVHIVNNCNSAKHSITIDQATGIMFYKLCQQLPANADFQYMNDLCSYIIKEIEFQVWEQG